MRKEKNWLTTAFFSGTHWFYIWTIASPGIEKLEAFAVVLVASDYFPEKYGALSRIFAKVVLRLLVLLLFFFFFLFLISSLSDLCFTKVSSQNFGGFFSCYLSWSL